MSNQSISIRFREEMEEEISHVFLLEDLIKEYNHKIVSEFIPAQNKKVPLSLSNPLKEDSVNPIFPLKENSAYPIIRAMTHEEINSMKSSLIRENDLRLLRNILNNQISPKGLAPNIPSIAQGATLMQLVQELGFTGKVYYKIKDGKTYVILKGLAKNRIFLKGTVYLNTNPQIVQFGLAKMTFRSATKSGFKCSIWIYGAVKAVEATGMLLEDGKLKPSFFSEVATDIPKIAITSAVAAAVATGVVAAGVPVAVGVGLVLVVGFAAGFLLDFFDQKTGLTEKVNDTAEKMWKDLEAHMSNNAKNSQRFKDWDPRKGLVFEGSFTRRQQTLRNYLAYTA